MDSLVYVLTGVVKHLAGQHDQSRHGVKTTTSHSDVDMHDLAYKWDVEQNPTSADAGYDSYTLHRPSANVSAMISKDTAYLSADKGMGWRDQDDFLGLVNKLSSTGRDVNFPVGPIDMNRLIGKGLQLAINTSSLQATPEDEDWEEPTEDEQKFLSAAKDRLDLSKDVNYLDLDKAVDEFGYGVTSLFYVDSICKPKSNPVRLAGSHSQVENRIFKRTTDVTRRLDEVAGVFSHYSKKMKDLGKSIIGVNSVHLLRSMDRLMPRTLDHVSDALNMQHVPIRSTGFDYDITNEEAGRQLEVLADNFRRHSDAIKKLGDQELTGQVAAHYLKEAERHINPALYSVRQAYLKEQERVETGSYPGVAKHQPGHHDQEDHAGDKAKGYNYDEEKETVFNLINSHKSLGVVSLTKPSAPGKELKVLSGDNKKDTSKLMDALKANNGITGLLVEKNIALYAVSHPKVTSGGGYSGARFGKDATPVFYINTSMQPKNIEAALVDLNLNLVEHNFVQASTKKLSMSAIAQAKRTGLPYTTRNYARLAKGIRKMFGSDKK